jgi:hypothetical protein
MKVTFTVDNVEHTCSVPYEGAAFVLVDGWACPTCKRSGVAGRNQRIESHDTYASDAGCADCKVVVGVLRVQLSTLFGLEEDERVLNGRCRVY